MSEIIQWQGHPVDVQARLISRFLLDHSIQLRLFGRAVHPSDERSDEMHRLTFRDVYSFWFHTLGRAVLGILGFLRCSTYKLQIDGVPSSQSRVRVREFGGWG